MPHFPHVKASFELPLSLCLPPLLRLAGSYWRLPIWELSPTGICSVNNADVQPRTEDLRFVYEARVGLLVAGELDFDFRVRERMVFGAISDSKSMSEYYTWTGRFAAKGEWTDKRPLTESLSYKAKVQTTTTKWWS